MPSGSLLYFAYGSNMSTARMLNRLPQAHPVGMADLSGYQLHFHKRGMDGSAKCNALFHAGGSGVMYGAVYRISTRDKARLDFIEGLGSGYREAEVHVTLGGHGPVFGITYLATHIDGRLRPFDWYLEHVLAGAQEWRLPQHYVARIASEPVISDPDGERSARERAIHA